MAAHKFMTVLKGGGREAYKWVHVVFMRAHMDVIIPAVLHEGLSTPEGDEWDSGEDHEVATTGLEHGVVATGYICRGGVYAMHTVLWLDDWLARTSCIALAPSSRVRLFIADGDVCLWLCLWLCLWSGVML